MQVVSERSRTVSPTVSVQRIEQKPFTYWLEKFWTEDRETYRLGVITRTSNFRVFMRWIVTQPGYEPLAGSDLDTQGRELLIRHIQAEDAYVMVDLVERYIQRGMQGKRRKTKQSPLRHTLLLQEEPRPPPRIRHQDTRRQTTDQVIPPT